MLRAATIYDALRGIMPEPDDQIARDVYAIWLHLANSYKAQAALRGALNVISYTGHDGEGCASLARTALRANPSIIDESAPIGSEVIIEAQRREIQILRLQLRKNQRFVDQVATAAQGTGAPAAVFAALGLGGAPGLMTENDAVLAGPSVRDLCVGARDPQEAARQMERAFTNPLGDALVETLRTGQAAAATPARGEMSVSDLIGFGRLLTAAEVACKEPISPEEGKRSRALLKLAAMLASTEVQGRLDSRQATLLALAQAVGAEAATYRDFLLRAQQFISSIPAGGSAARQKKAGMLQAIREALKIQSALATYEGAMPAEPVGTVAPFTGPRRIEKDDSES